MSGTDGVISLTSLSDACDLTEYDTCDESGCSIKLDDISPRKIFRPEEMDDDYQRADYSVFFPEPQDNESSGRGIPLSDEDDNEGVDYVAAIELKSTVDSKSKIRSQIKGAVSFIFDTLRRISNPEWGIKCLCLVAFKSSNIPLRKNPISFQENLDGRMKRFTVLPMKNNDKLVDILDQYGEDAGTPI